MFRFLALIPFFLSAALGFAQLTYNVLPRSFQPENAAFFPQIPVFQVGMPDVGAALREDESMQESSRFAVPVQVDISPETAGEWVILPDGDQVWRCAMSAQEALGLLLFFDRFILPESASFHAYSADKKTLLGAYGAGSCIPSGSFLIGVLPGESIYMEYYLPSNIKYNGEIHLNRVDYAYRESAIYTSSEKENFGSSLTCNVNVNCPAGTNWQTQKRGIARVLMVFNSGSAWCSGSLMANTDGTGVPYFLTAHHCQILLPNPKFDQWRFDFDYESSTCVNPAAEPQRKSVLGCTRQAFWGDTDFLLLKLNPIPSSYNLYFNGWSRETAALVSTSTFIHHPMGDIKKISTDNQTLTSYSQQVDWGLGFGISSPNTHWNNIPDLGIFEPGSSGCPLFDPAKRVIGQLHGGFINQFDKCKIDGALFGRFDISWDAGTSSAGRLRDWLDPANRNKITQNGYDQPLVPLKISGYIKTSDNQPLENVRVRISGNSTAQVLTDANGFYEFANLSSGGNYTVTPVSDSLPLNGVSTYDLVLISKHILGLEALSSSWKMLAADANKSNSITTLDIVDLRKLILGIYPNLPSMPSWKFYGGNSVIPFPQNPFEPGTVLMEQVVYNILAADALNVNFTAVKIGDTNEDADTK
jgi:lysyl endopeptidase